MKISTRLHYDSQAYIKALVWEFRLIFRDKAVLFSFIGVALIVSFLYTYVYSKEVLTDLPIGIVDNDNTTHSRQLLRMIDATSQTKISNYFTSLSEAEQAFDRDKIRGIVVIPVDFSKSLQRGEQPTVSVYADASYMLYYKQIVTAVKTSVTYLNAGIQIKKASAKGNIPTQARDKVVAVSGKVVSLFNPSSGYATFLIPIVLIIIFQTTILTSTGILGGTMIEEKKMQRVYPHANIFLGTLPLVMGKATTYLILSILILLIMMGIVMPMFNIPMRSDFLNVLVYLIPFFLSIVYLGIFLSSFFKHREDGILFIMFTSIPAIMLTGFSYPTQMLPKWVEVFSYFIPSTLGAKGFVELTQMGADFPLVIKDWLLLWGLCIFYLILAILGSKRSFLIEKH